MNGLETPPAVSQIPVAPVRAQPQIVNTAGQAVTELPEGAEQFDGSQLTEKDMAALQQVIQTQGRPAARALMHQW